MKKVLIIQEVLSRYNVPLFEQLSSEYDLTLMITKKSEIETSLNIIVNPIKKKMGINFFEKNIYESTKSFDIIICSPNFQFLNLFFSSLLFRKKMIYYGIGVSASYINQYDSKKWIGYFFGQYLKIISAAIFYSNYPKGKYANMGVNIDKLFVANNTIAIMEKIDDKIISKSSILFVGSLYKEKGIFDLLENYKETFEINNNTPILNIVGEGKEKLSVNNFIIQNKLMDKIYLRGEIYDEIILKSFFEEAIFCVSLNQAGLSVLKSMGYGVPFVTTKNAITGGEIFNIINNENGLILNESSDIKDVIEKAITNKEEFSLMGKKAKEFYDANCTVEQMVQGFKDAIEYSIVK